MFKAQSVASGFSVNDLEAAKRFYTEVMGLELEDETMGLTLRLPGGGTHFIYAKDDHQPATFTVLNFIVDDITTTVDELAKLGVSFEHYDNDEMPQDEKGVMHGLSAGYGPDIAWFKDPAGNVLAVLQDTKSEGEQERI